MIKRILLIVIIISYCNLGAGIRFQTNSFSDKKFQYLIEVEKNPLEETPILIIRFCEKDYISKLASYYATIIGFFGMSYFSYQMGLDGDIIAKREYCLYSSTYDSYSFDCIEVTSCCLLSLITGTVLGSAVRRLLADNKIGKYIFPEAGLDKVDFSIYSNKSNIVLKKRVKEGTDYLKINLKSFGNPVPDSSLITIKANNVVIYNYLYLNNISRDKILYEY